MDKLILPRQRKRSLAFLLATLVFAPPLFPARAFPNASIYVAPSGDDLGPGTETHPLRTLEKAQDLVREQNRMRDVRVVLSDGVYVLNKPLRFVAEDGGRGKHQVVWEAAKGAHPIIAGGAQVNGWRLFDKERNIYIADVPRGLDSRQVWVNDVLAERPAIKVNRSDLTFTSSGFTINNPNLAFLSKVKTPSRLEVESIGQFTDRYSPVSKIDANVVTMQQPAWDNNTWGYDSLQNPGTPEEARLFLVNALELMGFQQNWTRSQEQWFIDPAEGKLYLKPANDADIEKLTVVLPHLGVLISIGGTYDKPVQNLKFVGLRFSYSSWTQPSTAMGYANQQSGTFITVVSAVRPPDAYKSCSTGCPEFESVRQLWDQMPAAVQVSAARNIDFENDTFSQLGQIALGIGNDANANLSGVGLGADAIYVTRSRFAVLSGGAIVAGGVRVDAHHPSDPRMINKNLIISNNVITDVGKDYKDNAAILSTYVDTLKIVHNDISDADYDGIDIGWGWGYNDKGGSADYRDNRKGYLYNPIFAEPTTLRNNLVAYNRVHGVKRQFIDGGAIYNLSASPQSEIKENYIFDIGQRIGIYLDEGSRGIHVSRNVVDTHGLWLNANTMGKFYQMLVATENTAKGNWHTSDEVGGTWTQEIENVIVEDHLVPGKDWGSEAERVVQNSGIALTRLKPPVPNGRGPKDQNQP